VGLDALGEREGAASIVFREEQFGQRKIRRVLVLEERVEAARGGVGEPDHRRD
jgi:hypothetical protein